MSYIYYVYIYVYIYMYVYLHIYILTYIMNIKGDIDPLKMFRINVYTCIYIQMFSYI
jgi:hypothetical protein